MRNSGAILGIFLGAVIFGSFLIISSILLFWLGRPEDEYCEHMLGNSEGSCARCEGT